ncbi:MAG: ATP phosphoribosyltransferase regulatory subunit, partial [Methylococcales bacterium]
MMAADTMEALGIARKEYVINVNSRKILDSAMNTAAIPHEKRLDTLRSLDKFDRLGEAGVVALLGPSGRVDESGDRTAGVGLERSQIELLMRMFFLTSARFVPGVQKSELTATELADQPRGGENSDYGFSNIQTCIQMRELAIDEGMNLEGIDELLEILKICDAAGYGPGRVRISPSVIRGLEYYTGPVFECELLMETKDEDGKPVRFGSVGGGGRYDDLVARFTGQKVPATGFSLGVSRLYAALKLAGLAEESATLAPVVVLVMDKERQGDYWRMVQELRKAGIRVEMYMGTAGLKAQIKYADKLGSPLVIIQGGDEKAKGEVQIKDLRLGAELAAGITSREDYAGQRLA